MIKKETIDAIFEAARVEEVIGDFVQLKKAGSNYKGLSPFVNEKSPSFMVNEISLNAFVSTSSVLKIFESLLILIIIFVFRLMFLIFFIAE